MKRPSVIHLLLLLLVLWTGTTRGACAECCRGHDEPTATIAATEDACPDEACAACLADAAPIANASGLNLSPFLAQFCAAWLDLLSTGSSPPVGLVSAFESPPLLSTFLSFELRTVILVV